MINTSDIEHTPSHTLLVFVGHADDAKQQAEWVRETQSVLQEELTRRIEHYHCCRCGSLARNSHYARFLRITIQKTWRRNWQICGNWMANTLLRNSGSVWMCCSTRKSCGMSSRELGSSLMSAMSTWSNNISGSNTCAWGI